MFAESENGVSGETGGGDRYSCAMVLEELHELIETLQRRIAEHGPALQQSEALTRYALIDPLLRGLGWDTGDPSQVIPEFKSRRGSADYALLGGDGKPDVIIEAKRLGRGLEDAVEQVFNYCTREGYEFFAVTDGQHWELYETHRRGDIEEKLLVRLNLSDAPPKTCLDALALWRPSVVAGNIAAGSTPALDDKLPDPPIDDSRFKPPKEAPIPDGVVDTSDWESLSELAPLGNAKPVEVRLPGGIVATARGWSNMTAALVQWLVDNGHLQQSLMPIQSPNAKRYLVSTSPKHSSGTPFKRPRQIGSFYVEMNHSGSSHIVNSRTIIERTNQDPAEFGVRLQ